MNEAKVKEHFFIFSENKIAIFIQHQGPMLQNFFLCNLQIFIISWSACPWQAFPA